MYKSFNARVSCVVDRVTCAKFFCGYLQRDPHEIVLRPHAVVGGRWHL